MDQAAHHGPGGASSTKFERHELFGALLGSGTKMNFRNVRYNK